MSGFLVYVETTYNTARALSTPAVPLLSPFSVRIAGIAQSFGNE
jgi:hypothetical protein